MLGTMKAGQRALTQMVNTHCMNKIHTDKISAAATALKPELYNPLPEAEDNRPIIPKFWTGQPAVPFEDFQIDCSKFQMDKIVQTSTINGETETFTDNDFHETKALKDEMSYKFNKVGAVQLIKTGLEDMTSMEKVSKLVSGKGMKYEGGANLRGYVEKNVYDTGAPLEAHIHYHTEMAYVKESTKWLAFLCQHGCRDPKKGGTFLSDKIKATDTLFNKYPKLGNKLKEKGICYVRKLPDLKFFEDNNLDKSIVYNFWQTSMQTEDMDEAVKVANRKGLEVEWQESPMFGRYMVTKFYVSAFEYDPYSDKNVIYSSIADDYMWFDTWKGVMDLPHWERPLKMNFGDDEVMTREEKQQFVDIFDAHGTPCYWSQGDISVVCNFRMAHGRPGFSLEEGEKRELGVVLGETFARVGDLSDKW